MREPVTSYFSSSINLVATTTFFSGVADGISSVLAASASAGALALSAAGSVGLVSAGVAGVVWADAPRASATKPSDNTNARKRATVRFSVCMVLVWADER